MTLLHEHAVVSIVGAGGIGKTRLALAAAAAARLELPDGRWWVELAPINEVRRSRTVSAGRSECSCLPVDRRRKRSRWHSRARSLLLVLDNCEHLADDIAAVD